MKKLVSGTAAANAAAVAVEDSMATVVEQLAHPAVISRHARVAVRACRCDGLRRRVSSGLNAMHANHLIDLRPVNGMIRLLIAFHFVVTETTGKEIRAAGCADQTTALVMRTAEHTRDAC
jgi:hypothetical protein